MCGTETLAKCPTENLCQPPNVLVREARIKAAVEGGDYNLDRVSGTGSAAVC